MFYQEPEKSSSLAHPIDFLKDGDLVIMKNGEKYLYWKSQGVFFSLDTGHMPINNYDAYLRLPPERNPDYDIEKIYRIDHPNVSFRFQVRLSKETLIWERNSEMKNQLMRELKEIKGDDPFIANFVLGYVAEKLVDSGWRKEK